MSTDLISVLHFTNASDRGGAEEHILTNLRKTDRRFFRLHLVCPPKCLELLRLDIPEDVAVFPLTLNKPYDITAARRFAAILRNNEIQVLHSHLFGSSIAASPVGWLCRVPAVVETPHIREAWRHGLIKGSYAIDRVAARFVDRFIAVSEANARYLIDEKRLPPEKIQVIRNGSDLKRFSQDHKAPTGMKESLGFASEDPILLVLGRLEPQKGHSVLLNAMKDIINIVPRVRLLCLGDGALRAELESQVSDLGLASHVRFLGFQRNVDDWLSIADVSVLPSFFEGLPLAAIESLAAQRPIVATAVDGTTEVVVNEKTGLTVAPGDSRALAIAIIRLLQDKDLALRLASAGRGWVQQHFSEEMQIAETQNLYFRALGREPIVRVEGSRSSSTPRDQGPTKAHNPAQSLDRP